MAIEIATGEFTLIQAKSVIIATGGAGRVFRENTNGGIVTGDGMALAYRHGVPLRDMEFVQYHPTCMPGTGLLFTEACRGEGGFLLNKDGYRYLQDYGLGPAEDQAAQQGHGTRPARPPEPGLLARAAEGPHHRAARIGSVVHLDLRHLGEAKLRERLPQIYELAEEFMGVDPAQGADPGACRRCTTPWAASWPTARRRRRCRACTRSANAPASASTAPTVWARTR